MLDIKFITENKSVVINNLKKRGFTEIHIIDKLADLYDENIKLEKEVDVLKNERNVISKQIGIKKSQGEDISELIQKVRSLPDTIKEYDIKIKDIKTQVQDYLYSIPNLLDETVPEGLNEEFNKEIKLELKKNEFDFEPLNHWDIGTGLGIFDFERASKVTGSRFVVLKNKGSVLERALISFMLEEHNKLGYEEIMPPFIINSASLFGTGQLPKFKEDLFKLEGTDYYLVPTAEVPITNLHRNEIIDKDKLPISYCSFTPCFRAEAGSWGKDTRGIIRQHQFNKIELVKLVEPETSEKQLEILLNNAENILKKLGLHYRVVLLCSGDTGFSSSKTYDIEVWMPAQKKYREISSCSNFKDYQARRMNIRYKPEEKSKTEFIHTINGSGLAVGRTMAAILENFQNSDGSVDIPEVLHKFTGFDKINK